MHAVSNPSCVERRRGLNSHRASHMVKGVAPILLKDEGSGNHKFYYETETINYEQQLMKATSIVISNLVEHNGEVA
jgi:hypothetical protein